VQIDNNQRSDIVLGLVANIHDPRIAQRHLHTLPTRMALMRWTRGGDIPHVPGPGRDVSKRAAWYDRMQDDFQAWLAAGGFHQAEAGKGAAK